MDFAIASWNVGGVDFLRTSPSGRPSKRERFNADLRAILSQANPDVLVVQETVRYGLEFRPQQGTTEELFDEPDGYHYACSVAIDTEHNYHPVKWTPIREGGRWAPNTYLGQGYGIFWRRSIPHCSIWETNHELARTDTPIEKEDVRIEGGLFTGNRDTEPRLVVVAHFVFA
jgi:hypothetical protein